MSDEKRAEEERVRRETEERLASFRKAQLAVGGGGAGDVGDGSGSGSGSGDVEVEEWGLAAGRKRKRDKEREKAGLKGVRRRISMSGDEKREAGEAKRRDDTAPSAATKPTLTSAEPESAATKKLSSAASAASTQNVNATATQKPALGLVDYGSDSDDED